MTARRGIGVGIVGAGSVLWAYLQQLDRLVPRGLAWEGPVCARRPETWSRLRERRPGITLVGTPGEVLTSDVEVVVILTSPSSHAALALEAVRAGKHVVVEKPLGRSVAEAAAVFDEADAREIHVLAAPFVHLSPTFRELWTRVADGEIGRVHAARASYGNLGAPWASWFREGEAGPVAEVGIYQLRSLTALLGPAAEVFAAASSAGPGSAPASGDDVAPGTTVQVVLTHRSGAVSTITASHGMHAYRRPAIELFGTRGTANLLGDDWDPAGLEIWRDDAGAWTSMPPRDPTWLWTDGLRELVGALTEGRPPLASRAHDLHVLELVELASASAAEGRSLRVRSAPAVPDLRVEIGPPAHVHDRTRPPGEQ